MLKITKLTAGYNGNVVLKGVSLEIGKNEIVALIGPNGAGKSTVIKAVFNIAKVRQGRILFLGKDITRTNTHRLIRMGICYVPQGRINFGNLTVEENLEIGADAFMSKKQIEAGKDVVFKKFPLLKERRKEIAYGLSGGQQQMLAIGRALIQKPKLLLLDEPSLGLSPILQKEVFSTLQQLRKEGLSIMVVEQNAKRAIEIADKTYLLENGKVVLHGGKEILKDQKIKNVYLGGGTTR